MPTTKKPKEPERTPEEFPPKYPGALCHLCPLYDRPLVPSFGPDKAEYVLVGEAPGRDEVQQGRPFVGKSGKLLNMILRHHGIGRDDVFVTNACLCRPPLKKGKNSPPNAQAMKACQERLLQEVKDREPRRVIAAGGVGAKSLLGGKEGIKAMRIGGPKPHPDGYEVVPTFHPAYALRSPDAFPSIVGDVKKAIRINVGWEPTKYKVVDDIDKAERFIRKQAEAADLLTLDVEVDHRSDSHSRFTPDWLCIGVSHRPGASVVYTERLCKDPRFQQALKKLIDNKPLGYQNGKFDTQHLWSFAPGALVTEDTMMAHYALDERKGTHDLEQLGAEFLGAPSYKTEARQWLKKKGDSLRNLPPEVLYKYNATDTDVTHRLIPELRDAMAKDGVTSPYENLLIPGTNAFAELEYAGVQLDVEYLRDEIGNELLQEKGETKEKVLAIAAQLDWTTEKFSNSPQQIVRAFSELYGISLDSSDKDTIDPLAAKGVPLAKALLAYRKVDKLYGTYVASTIQKMDSDGRVRSDYKLHGTETGRGSSSEPNMQNQPMPEPDNPNAYNIRDAFVAREGYSILSCDYAGIEMVVAAYLTGDKFMLDLFRRGVSFHKIVAGEVFGKSYTKRQYRITKSINFGSLYDETPGHLAYRLQVPKKEAIAIQKTFFTRFAGLKPFHKEVQQTVLDDGELQSVTGRKRRFWLITDDNRKHLLKEALNFPIQSLAHDFTLRSLIRLTPLLKKYDARPIIEVHDSLSVEVPDQHIDEVAHLMKEIMEDTIIADVVPTKVEASVGKRWGSEVEYEFAA